MAAWLRPARLVAPPEWYGNGSDREAGLWEDVGSGEVDSRSRIRPFFCFGSLMYICLSNIIFELFLVDWVNMDFSDANIHGFEIKMETSL